MDQPQRHVTRKTGHDLGQLGHLVGRGRVQVLPRVHLRAQVGVLLKPGERDQLRWSWVGEAEDRKSSRATYIVSRGESKGDGGDPGKGQEGVRRIVHLQRLHSATHTLRREVNMWNRGGGD